MDRPKSKQTKKSKTARFLSKDFSDAKKNLFVLLNRIKVETQDLRKMAISAIPAEDLFNQQEFQKLRGEVEGKLSLINKKIETVTDA